MPQPIHHPKQDHPWRQYKNRKNTTLGANSPSAPQIPLKEFLKNIVDNWDTYKIPPANLDDREYISLAKINPDKQAEWLMGFLKKNWLSSNKGALIFE